MVVVHELLAVQTEVVVGLGPQGIAVSVFRSGIDLERDVRGYYSALRKQFREKHWKTDDIDQLAKATFDLGNDAKRRTYEDLTKKYVDKWRAEDATNYFEVPPARVSFGDLSVTVGWVVGIRTRWPEGTSERAFILWLSKYPFPSDILNVSSYLLGQAAEHAGWSRFWRLGIWDVGCSNLLDAVSPTDDTEEWIHQCAAEFAARSARARQRP